MKKFVLFLSFIFSITVSANVLFEGYYKVTQLDNHIGFIVIRNELDAKTKQFKTTSLLRLAKNGFDVTESLTTVSDENIYPVKYTYLSTQGDSVKTIDGVVKKNKLVATIVENNKKKTVEHTINKDVFFSSALYYMILKSKTGLKTGTNFDFSAIAEETAQIEKGTCDLDQKYVTEGKLQLIKAKMNYMNKYENLITDKGEIYSAHTPSTNVKTVLVKTAAEATEGIKLSRGILEKIFGQVPEGKINPLYTK